MPYNTYKLQRTTLTYDAKFALSASSMFNVDRSVTSLNGRFKFARHVTVIQHRYATKQTETANRQMSYYRPQLTQFTHKIQPKCNKCLPATNLSLYFPFLHPLLRCNLIYIHLLTSMCLAVVWPESESSVCCQLQFSPSLMRKHRNQNREAHVTHEVLQI